MQIADYLCGGRVALRHTNGEIGPPCRDFDAIDTVHQRAPSGARRTADSSPEQQTNCGRDDGCGLWPLSCCSPSGPWCVEEWTDGPILRQLWLGYGTSGVIGFGREAKKTCLA